jgi:periplasmic copper chaperone A
MLFSLAAAGVVHAADYEAGNLVIAQPWSRPTPPVASTGVVYLSVRNRGSKADRLLTLSTPAAHSAEIHETRTVNGMMEMRPVATLNFPPNTTVKVEPGGLHIMLIGLSRPLAAGMEFPLTMRFQDAGEVTVQVRVGEGE